MKCKRTLYASWTANIVLVNCNTDETGLSIAYRVMKKKQQTGTTENKPLSGRPN